MASDRTGTSTLPSSSIPIGAVRSVTRARIVRHQDEFVEELDLNVVGTAGSGNGREVAQQIYRARRCVALRHRY